MYDLKIEDGQPFLRNGTPSWGKPLVDEAGCFFASARQVSDKYHVPASTLSQALAMGHKVRGRVYRFATLTEVQQHLKGELQPYEPSKDALAKRVRYGAQAKTKVKRKSKSKTKVKRKSKARRPTTIEIEHPLTSLGTPLPFDGHEFAGGPAILVLPGTTFRMERPTKNDFPKELRDACRWS